MALFALTMQFVLSFGHVHLDGVGSAHASAVAAVQASADATDRASLPGHPDDGAADDYCPICALIHLADSLVSAEAPLLALPAVFGRLQLTSKPDARLAASPRGLFSARAPPIA